MAEGPGHQRRARSTTGASKTQTEDELNAVQAILDTLRRLSTQGIGAIGDELCCTLQDTELLIGANEIAKDTFRQHGGFEILLHFLSVVSSTTIGAKPDRHTNGLCLACNVITTAICEHRGNLRYFAYRLNGWITLEKAIVSHAESILAQTELHSPSTQLQELGKALVALATCGGQRDHAEEHVAIQHGSAVSILLKLAALDCRQKGGNDMALNDSIVGIHEVISKSIASQVAVWDTNIISMLLKRKLQSSQDDARSNALSQIFNDIAHFGLHDLNDVALLFDHARTSEHARLLLLDLLIRSREPAFVQFDLSLHGHCSLELPSLPKAFPPTTGYTFSLWLRFDKFDPTCHTTIFGAFDASQACFVLVYLEKDTHQLILQTSIRSARPSVRFRSTTFETGTWYHIAIVHRRAALDHQNSPAMLFVDGEFAEQVKCAYPESSQQHLDDEAATRQRALPVQAFLGTPRDLSVRLGRNEINACWSFASAHLFQMPLTDEFIAVQRRLGPRYFGNFQDCLGPLLTYRASAELNRYNELLHPDKKERSDIVQATEHRGSDVIAESKILFSFAARSVIYTDGRHGENVLSKAELDRKALLRYSQLAQKTTAIIINTAVLSINDALLRPCGTAILAGDPVVALPKHVDDASWCLAGTLPMLYTLLEAADSKDAFLQSVRIFFECVKENWRISEAMEKTNGYGALAIAIRQKLGLDLGATSSLESMKQMKLLPIEERQTTALELLRMILDFVGHDSAAPERSMIINPMAYRVLLIDFDTWRRCDSKIIELYFGQFVDFVVRNQHHSFNHKRFTKMRAVKRLIEAMKIEDFDISTLQHLMSALHALLDNPASHANFKDLAMFIAFGLHDERASRRSIRSMASAVRLQQQITTWTSKARQSRPHTPTQGSPPQLLTRSQLAMHTLKLLANILCEPNTVLPIRRFVKAVPTRWLSHTIAESDPEVIVATLKIISHALAQLGAEFKHPFVDKNSGFVAMRSRLRTFWRCRDVWYLIFSILFGQPPGRPGGDDSFSVFDILDRISVDANPRVMHQDVVPVLTALLETGLRHVVKDDEPSKSDAHVITTVIRTLGELYTRSHSFREYATSSKYAQELLFVLYPVIVGSDRLAASMEMQADKNSLSFKGEEVVMRPHSNSLGERPPSVRSLNLDRATRTPSPGRKRIANAPKRLSSFVLVTSANGKTNLPSTRFSPALSPQAREPVKLNIGNSIVESLLEIIVDLFIDQVCNKKDFNGIGLFQKVPPGFMEHQAYFESYVIIHTLSQLWSHLQFHPELLQDTKVLTNLSRYAQHLAEAVFEGWFIDGAQPVIDFLGNVLECLQQPHIAEIKTVRLCSQAINSSRIVFLRVTLLRLSELDESVSEAETVHFLNQMSYWQMILFATDNQETLFIRLICFLLYLKLTSQVKPVRVAAAGLWRAVLMQKPTETATLLAYSVASDKRHLSTGFMNLVSLDDNDFLQWIDEHRAELDTVLIDTLAKPWAEFVNDENRRNEETAKSRLSKRRDKLRQWQAVESSVDHFLNRYESSTSHWRSNVHAQERLKSQRALQDHHESVNNILTVFSRIERQLIQPSGPYPDSALPKWRLDETEGLNRMRMRMLRDHTRKAESFQPKRKATQRGSPAGLTINTRLPKLALEIATPTPITPLMHDLAREAEQDNNDRSRSESISNSQLLEGGFEMVEDPKADEDGLVEDKNRKVMTSLRRGDMVQQLYNISRIVGLEACEGLLVVGKDCLYLQDNFFQRSDGEIVSTAQAPEDERDPYLQLISGKDVGSQQTKNSTGDQVTRHWTWTAVLSISKRRFLLRDVSLEIFFTDGRSYLLTVMSTKLRDELYNAVITRAPHVHGTTTVASEDAWRLDNLRNPEELPTTIGSRFATVFSGTITHAATKRWVKGEMSNFQYLMLVNTMAGRTFNDLTQYPVFPWVLADYQSEELDLENPATFRDFSKPMGCQTPAREAEFKDRYKQFAEMGDQNAPAFNYGTHYSSAMIVSSYLIRLQPFVQSYLLLQGGNFDHADRLFDSIERAWLSASKDNMSDVRELTPEFFYLPEFLRNVNQYDFGTKQGDGGIVNDVILPRWAKDDPHLFVAKHREALESPYVSKHLHQWIDLVFGCKQRGEAAIAATNVFQHLSYGGAKDLDTIDDPVERLATIGIIHSFGQTPHQVFHRPHPARDVDKLLSSRLDANVESLIKLPSPLFESEERITELTYSHAQERLLCSGPGKTNMLPSCDRFMQWKMSDNTIRFYSANTKRLVGLYENTQIGPITTALFADSKTLVTAGKDCTLTIWTITSTRDWIEMQSGICLFGHRAAVSLVTASRVFSTLLTASDDGHVLLWDLNRHSCLRVLHPAGSGKVQTARISNLTGHIALCCGQYVAIHTLNGQLLLRQRISDSPHDDVITCAFYEGVRNEWVERELLFTGHSNGVVNVWTLTALSDGSWHLQLLNRLNHADVTREDGGNISSSITAILPMTNAVYTGDDHGKVWQWDLLVKQGVTTGRVR